MSSALPIPRRPSALEEPLSSRVFFAFSPPMPGPAQPAVPPPQLAPFAEIRVPRRRGEGCLTGTWFPAPGPARGAVLLLHPWVPWGRAYFHLRGRLPALREAGYHAFTLDLPGFGGSGPRAGLFDLDVEDGLTELQQRAQGLPVHIWGVSCGGTWAHPVLSRHGGVSGAVFEDTSPHLLEWSWRMVPQMRHCYRLLRTAFPRTYRYLDARRHAPALGVSAVTYLSGENDPGILPQETEELARLAGGTSHIVPGAGHLGAIKLAQARVLDIALETFARAERISDEARHRDVSGLRQTPPQ